MSDGADVSMIDSIYMHWWVGTFQEWESFAYDWINRMLKKFGIKPTHKKYLVSEVEGDCFVQLVFNHPPKCGCKFCMKRGLLDRRVVTISMTPFAAENYLQQIKQLCDLPPFSHEDVAIRISYDKGSPEATPEDYKIFDWLALQDDVEILI